VDLRQVAECAEMFKVETNDKDIVVTIPKEYAMQLFLDTGRELPREPTWILSELEWRIANPSWLFQCFKRRYLVK